MGKYRRKRWYPELTDRGNWESWEATGARDVREMAREEVRRVLAEHHLQYVTGEQPREIDTLGARRAELGLADGPSCGTEEQVWDGYKARSQS